MKHMLQRTCLLDKLDTKQYYGMCNMYLYHIVNVYGQLIMCGI